MSMKLTSSQKRKISDGLSRMNTNIYHDGLPIDAMKMVLERHGAEVWPLDGIYCGAEGRWHTQVSGS